ncbi:CdaR family protein [Leadbettera azotonutricia]|uniref:CdaR family protein n=1 Tax=Leadbettera azotonutricia TaxID=150829 RepID=UPI00030315A5|nr:YbbR-like domain-containing protein [Leadbettera azotonutricia]
MNTRKLLAKATENWPAKVISIGLAIILFIFHRMSTLEERFFTVPLNIEVKGNLIPSSPYPRMVRITLRGDANSIYPILEDDIEAFINLSRYEAPGDYKAAVQIRKNGTALGIEPLEVNVDPTDISVSLDHKISKFVPLTASLRGNVAQGYVLNSHSLNPTQVIIDGPSQLIGNISELSTEAIDLEGRAGDFTVMANILNRDPLIVIRGNGITEFHGIVSHIVPVRNVTDIPIRILNLDDEFSGELDIRAGSVHLEGTNQDELNRFSISEGFFTVDCSGIERPGSYTLNVAPAAIPENLSFSFEPRTLTILVSPKAAAPQEGNE